MRFRCFSYLLNQLKAYPFMRVLIEPAARIQARVQLSLSILISSYLVILQLFSHSNGASRSLRSFYLFSSLTQFEAVHPRFLKISLSEMSPYRGHLSLHLSFHHSQVKCKHRLSSFDITQVFQIRNHKLSWNQLYSQLIDRERNI